MVYFLLSQKCCKDVRVLVFVFCCTFGCRQLPNQTYFSNEVGWTFVVPDNWKISDGKFTSDSRLNFLTCFEKDDDNFFLATYSSKTVFFENYDEAKILIRDLFLTRLKRHGVQPECESGTLFIDGIEFDAYYCLDYLNNSEVDWRKFIIYAGKVDDKILWIIIHYTNEEDKNTIVQSFKNSRFKYSDKLS